MPNLIAMLDYAISSLTKGSRKKEAAFRSVSILALVATFAIRNQLLFNAEGIVHVQEGHRALETKANFEAYNTVWKQSINDTISCSTGEAYGKKSMISFPKSPHFIIIGAQKAGTSALGEWLDMHPKLKNAHGEAHFFDENRFLLENLENLDDEVTMCKVRRRYHSINWQPLNDDDIGKIFFEKTPRYLIWPDVPKLIQKICPWNPKIIAILRNPISRLKSHHKMNSERERGTVGLSLDQAIHAELQVMRATGLTKAPLLTERSLHDNNDTAFAIPAISLHAREEKTKLLFDKAKKTEYWLIQRGMYAVQLESWLEHYRVGIDFHIIQYERMRSEPIQVWHEVQDFLQVPRHELHEQFLSTDYSPNKGEYKESMTVETTQYLKKFFKPYNDRLADLLGEEWRGVWD